MKKTAIMMMLLIGAFITANAQVPGNIRTDFDKKYPNSNATWKSENGSYNAYYTDAEKRQRMISYDQNGRMTSNSTLINSADVPANISGYYKKNYPTDTGYKVWMDDMDGRKSYYTVSGTHKHYFDNNGNYTRSGTVNNMNTQPDGQKQNTPHSTKPATPANPASPK